MESWPGRSAQPLGSLVTSNSPQMSFPQIPTSRVGSFSSYHDESGTDPEHARFLLHGILMVPVAKTASAMGSSRLLDQDIEGESTSPNCATGLRAIGPWRPPAGSISGSRISHTIARISASSSTGTLDRSMPGSTLDTMTFTTTPQVWHLPVQSHGLLATSTESNLPSTQRSVHLPTTIPSAPFFLDTLSRGLPRRGTRGM